MRGLKVVSEHRSHRHGNPCIERIYECEYGLIHVVHDGGGGWVGVESTVHQKALNKYIKLAKQAGELHEA